ncbi:MAG: hypothetical protein QM751_06285 [Paludibacteraceae bacterium]
MKPKNYLLLILLLLAGVSCQKNATNMLTIIHADGSCDKEFVSEVDSLFMIGDSSKMSTSYFPVKVDKSWQISWRCENGEYHTNFPLKNTDSIFISNSDSCKNSFYVKIRKHFNTVDEMSKLDSVNRLYGETIKYELKKRFRWFYTYYSYTETYPKLKLIENILPISKYMSKDEAEYWLNGKPDMTMGLNGIEINDLSKELESKFNTWISNVLWNEEYRLFVENYDKLSHPPVSQSEFVMLSDTIFDKKAKNMLEKGIPDIDKILDDYFNTICFSNFAQKNSDLFNGENKILYLLSMIDPSHTINYSLQMPGKVISGNFNSLNNQTMSWKITSQRMFLQSYSIQAESRKANWWAFIVTIILLAGTLGSIFIKKKR